MAYVRRAQRARSTACTRRATRRSAASRARARSGPATTSAPGAGGGSAPRPANAASTCARRSRDPGSDLARDFPGCSPRAGAVAAGAHRVGGAASARLRRAQARVSADARCRAREEPLRLRVAAARRRRGEQLPRRGLVRLARRRGGADQRDARPGRPARVERRPRPRAHLGRRPRALEGDRGSQRGVPQRRRASSRAPSVVKDDRALLDRLLVVYEKKYPAEIGQLARQMRAGYADGSARAAALRARRRRAHVARELPDPLDLHLDHVAVAQRARGVARAPGSPPVNSRSPGSSVSRRDAHASSSATAKSISLVRPICSVLARDAAHGRRDPADPGPRRASPARARAASSRRGERASRSGAVAACDTRAEVERGAVAGDTVERVLRRRARARRRPITAASPAWKSSSPASGASSDLVLRPRHRGRRLEEERRRAGRALPAAQLRPARQRIVRLDRDELARPRHRRREPHGASRDARRPRARRSGAS